MCVDALVYEPNEKKHKWPKGFGSLCPLGLAQEVAQNLLQRSVIVGDNPRVRYAASGRWCFVARATRFEAGVWHGYPVVGSEVGEEVLRALQDAGCIDYQQRNRFRKQRMLPQEWP